MGTMFLKWFRWVGAYAFAVLIVGVALLATLGVESLKATPPVLFFAGIVVVAWLGGKGPTILAIILSIMAQDYFLIEPRFSILISIEDAVRFLEFTLVALLVCYLQDKLNRLATQLQQANAVLETRVQERTHTLAVANTSLEQEVQRHHKTQSDLVESEAQLRISLEKTQTALKEKEVLLRELHHRVKNNLQTIVSLISLQAKSNLDQPNRDHFKELQQRVRAIAMVHDRLHKVPNLSRIDVAVYFCELVHVLYRSYFVGPGVVTPKITIEETTLEVDHLIPCALIVNELVCNALKYAYPEGRSGEIRVELQRNEQLVRLMVADEGVGFSLSDTLRRPGVGLQLVQALVQQLSGNIQWANGCGTCAIITFPVST